MSLRNSLRSIIPTKYRQFFWSLIPKFHLVNTYVQHRTESVKELLPIDTKFVIREVTWEDKSKLIKAHSYRGPKAYKNRIPDRMNSTEWKGLAVINTNNGDIAYLAWIIVGSIKYFEEFGVFLKPGQFLLKDGFCVPEYRHRGLHTRMEQERINFCVKDGNCDIFIQIHDDNEKGKESVLINNYKLFRQNYVILWPIFNVYRELHSFLKNPFRKVVK